MRDVLEEASEIAEGVPAEELVLAEQEVRLHAVARRREPVLPDEGHPLDERPPSAHHAVEPPEVVVAPLVGGA